MALPRLARRPERPAEGNESFQLVSCKQQNARGEGEVRGMNIGAGAFNLLAQSLCLCPLVLKRLVLGAAYDPRKECSRSPFLPLPGLLNTSLPVCLLKPESATANALSLHVAVATSGSDHHPAHETAL